MKFIKELIAKKSAGSNAKFEEFGEEELRRDLAEGGFESPLAERKADPVEPMQEAQAELEMAQATSQQETPTYEGEFDAFEDEDDDLENQDWNLGIDMPVRQDEQMNGDTSRLAAALSPAKPAPEEEPKAAEQNLNTVGLDDWDDEDEPEEWDIGLSDSELAEANAVAKDASPELSYDSGEETEIFDEPTEFDEEQSARIESAAMTAVQEEEVAVEADKEVMIDEIRSAMKSVRHIRTDEEIDRQAAARDQLGVSEDAATDARIYDATDVVMNEDTGARRRQAIALMKAAAAATRSDPDLKSRATKDLTLDPMEQSDYRRDLEDFDRTDKTKPLRDAVSQPLEHMAEAQPETEHSEPSFAPVDEPDYEEDTFEETQAAAAPVVEEAPATTPVEEAAPIVDLSAINSGDMDASAAEQEATPAADVTDLRAALMARMPSKPLETAPEMPAIDETPDVAEASAPTPKEAEPVNLQVPPMAMGRSGRQAGRVKTRLLGFQGGDIESDDPFSKAKDEPVADARYPVGWAVVISGPGEGHAFAVNGGVTKIGRGDDQAIKLDFGDTAISRENHAAIAYDDEHNEFFLGHGGKSNLVRLNNRPVLSTEPLKGGDEIRIGETTLRFVALCNNEFRWQPKGAQNAGKAAIA